MAIIEGADMSMDITDDLSAPNTPEKSGDRPVDVQGDFYASNLGMVFFRGFGDYLSRTGLNNNSSGDGSFGGGTTTRDLHWKPAA